MKPKKEDSAQQPFHKARMAKDLEELKECWMIAEAELKNTHPASVNIRENLQKQIENCKIKIRAIKEGMNPMLAIKGEEGKIEPDLIRRTKSFRC